MNWGILRVSKATAVVFSLLSISFLLMGFHVTETVRSIRTTLLYWAWPAYDRSESVIRQPSSLASRLYEIVSAHRENRILKEKVKSFFLTESELTETRLENARLKELMALRPALPYETVPAQVSAHDLHVWSGSLFLNRGSNHGVVQDLPVAAIEGDPVKDTGVRGGLIGRVLEADENSSRVLLVSDPLSSVSVVLPRTGEQGLLQGQGALLVSVEYIDQLADVLVGDEVATSGLGGIFPSGLFVGRVSSILPISGGFKRVMVQPAVRMGKVREVLVLISKK